MGAGRPARWRCSASLADTSARPHRQPDHLLRRALARRCRPTASIASATARPRRWRRWSRSSSSRSRRSASPGARSTGCCSGERDRRRPRLASASRSSRWSRPSRLLAYQRYVIRRTGSVAIRTDHVHYQTRPAAQPVGDRGAGARPIARLAAPTRCSASRSPAGCSAARGSASSHAVDQLMDREWPEEEREALPRRRPRLSRAAGPPRPAHPPSRHRTDFVQFHVWVPGDWTVAQAHERDGRGRGEAAGPLPGDRDHHPPRPRGPHRPPSNPALESDLTESDANDQPCPSSRSMPSPTSRSPAIRRRSCRSPNGCRTR